MGRKLTHQQFVEKSIKIHGHKYKYPGTYVNNRTPIEIGCHVHGNFWQSPNSHLGGHGCKQCHYDLLKNSNDQFWQNVHTVHGHTYQYHSSYVGLRHTLLIECRIHGIFEQRADHHRNGSGCPQCHSNAHMGKEKFVDAANVIHEFKYSYPGEYEGSQTPIEICCAKHGSFWQKPAVHLQGHGCPHCPARVSRAETAWLDFLEIPSEYRQQPIKLNNKWIVADAHNPHTNTVYEFYGDYWHGNPQVFNSQKINSLADKTFGQLYQDTLSREALIKQRGYNLISIWENDWKRFQKDRQNYLRAIN